jgi:hypothetical protein
MSPAPQMHDRNSLGFASPDLWLALTQSITNEITSSKGFGTPSHEQKRRFAADVAFVALSVR